MLHMALIIALVAAFIILFLGRFSPFDGTSVRQWLIIHSPKILSELFDCDLCLSWWICLVVALVLAPFYGLWVVVAAPLATPVTRFLIG